MSEKDHTLKWMSLEQRLEFDLGEAVGWQKEIIKITHDDAILILDIMERLKRLED